MYRDLARRLRKGMTDAERFVWARLRHKQFDGFRFRRQAPIGPYIADFVCYEARLILELDGSQHAEQTDRDAVRTAWFETQGFRLLRAWNHQVVQDWGTVEAELWRLLTDAEGQPGDLRSEGWTL